MEAELKFLKDFYIQKKQHKAGSSINIEVDADMIPIDSVWYNQLKFEQNKSYFELKSLTQVKKINK